MSNPELYVGIMSGTSLDGIDTALLDLSQPHPRLIASHFQAYEQPLKDALLDLHLPAHNELHLAQLIANRLARDYAAATLKLLNKAKIAPEQIRAIGCHGQTIRHRPESGYTIQLNNAALLAELTGISVISDFRSRDIAAGGQGAPLVPAFHDRVLRHPDIHRVIVNIGGISNLTDLAPDKPTSGFDCGPGNLLMDAWISRHLGQPYDREGVWSTCGNLLPGLLDTLLSEPFFAAEPPKSSGRDLFNMTWLESHLNGDEAPEDVQATLLALTGKSIADAIAHQCSGAEEIYLCGGGAHNTALVAHLKDALPDCRIAPTAALGMDADWVEAIAFAWLAQQTLLGQPANLPAVTGARHPCALGAIYPA
ncbi:MAG: anhydro-N-acetylmuramic acid kinase [Nitrosomonadales bacterium]|nr:anhydro-N-acetylmuramic acid kinase [Nitrosomonadales bacterium]